MNIKKFLTNIVATIMFSSLAISSITFFDKKIEVGAEELEVEIIENNSTEVTLKQENISDFVKNGQCANELCYKGGDIKDCKTGKCF